MTYVAVNEVAFGPALRTKNAWADLDLSGASLVGSAKRVLAFLEYEPQVNEAWVYQTFLRPADDADAADDWRTSNQNTDMGTAVIKDSSSLRGYLAACMTSDAAVLQQYAHILAGAGGNLVINLYGYIDGTYDGTVVHSGAISSSWETLDLSGVVGANVAFCWLKVRATTNSGTVQFRDTAAASAGLYHSGGSAECRVDATDGPDQAVLVVTDASGHVSMKATNVEVDISVEYYTTNVTKADEVLFGATPAAPPTSYTTIDLSGTIGDNPALCLLRVDVDSSSGTEEYGARPAGETRDWLRPNNNPFGISSPIMTGTGQGYIVTPTNASGEIEWIASGTNQNVTLTLVAYTTSGAGPSPSGKVGKSTGSMPRGLTGPYPISGGMRAAGYLWREEFVNYYLSTKNGLALVGSPTFSVAGLALNGSSQYATLSDDAPKQSFGESQQFWIIEFTPDFEADDGSEHVLLDVADTDTATLTVYGVRKLGSGDSNVLRISLPRNTIDIALASYQDYWNVGERNTLIVNVGKSGGTETLLNGTQVDQTAAIFAAQGVGDIYIGADLDGATGFFDGTLHRLIFGLGSLSAAEAAGFGED